MRVYIPLDHGGLEGLARCGQLMAEGGFAVTPAFAQAYGSDDVEELEYAAMMVAAEASAELVGADGRRRVLAVDAAAAEPGGEEHPAAVQLTAPVGLADVAAIHVGESGEELAWYALQELEDVLAAG